MKKQLLQKVLQTYCVNANEVLGQLSFRKLVRGRVEISKAELIPGVLQDLIACMLPICAEVVSCHAAGLEVSLPWMTINSKPCRVKVKELCIRVRVHRPSLALAPEDDQERHFWQSQAFRFVTSQRQCDERSANGAQKQTVTEKIGAGLSAEVEHVRLELFHPGASEAEVIGDLYGIIFRPCGPDWQNVDDIAHTTQAMPGEYELAAFIRTEIERMVFSSACGGAKLSLDGFVKKETKKNPMLETLVVPDVWTSRTDMDIQALSLSGEEQPAGIVLMFLNDISTSYGLLEQLSLLLELDPGFAPEVDASTKNAQAATASFFDQSFGRLEASSSVGASEPQTFDAEFESDDEVPEGYVPQSEERVGPTKTNVSWWWKDEELPERAMPRLESFLAVRQSINVDAELLFVTARRSSVRQTRLQTKPLLIDQSLRDEYAALSSDDDNEKAPDAAPMTRAQSREWVHKTGMLRTSVKIASFEADIALEEGQLSLQLSELSFLCDFAMLMSPAALACVTELFGLSCREDASQGGLITQQIDVKALDVSFNQKNVESSSSPSRNSNRTSRDTNLSSSRKSGAEQKNSQVLKLSRLDPSALSFVQRGPAAPTQCGELQAEPMEINIAGLWLHYGLGVDAVMAWWGRLQSSLPQLADPPTEPSPVSTASLKVSPPPPLPSMCVVLRLHQSTVLQEPTQSSGLTPGGSWPVKVMVPFLEVRSYASLVDLPAAAHASILGDTKFDLRGWRDPILLPSEVPSWSLPGGASSVDDQGQQAETHVTMLRQRISFLEREVEAQQLENSKLKERNANLRTNNDQLRLQEPRCLNLSQIRSAVSSFTCGICCTSSGREKPVR